MQIDQSLAVLPSLLIHLHDRFNSFTASISNKQKHGGIMNTALVIAFTGKSFLSPIILCGELLQLLSDHYFNLLRISFNLVATCL
ncbi:hypothetical protein D1872_198650 [compost metagenome]